MDIPRIMIAAPMSGCGKTTVTCGLMQALKNRGHKIVAAKCGPDYIDPMFHRRVLETDSQNLDLFFCESQVMEALFVEHASGADLAVIEGVMGYYDGMALDSEKGSSYEVAATLKVPVLLTVNGKGAALSVLALLKGFLTFRKENHIAGIILNRTSGAVYPRMKKMIEQGLRDMGYPVPVVGYVPDQQIFQVNSRHLGLITPEEIGDLRAMLEQTGELLTETLDLDQIVKIANSAEPLKITAGYQRIDKKRKISSEDYRELPEGSKVSDKEKVRLAVARDMAFCFYYKDNLKLLEELGCELVPFSPLADASLPPDISGLLLGGGYPELYAGRLSSNVRLKEEIRILLEQGLPCHAECGGFMYLHEAMEGEDGRFHEMVGAIEGRAFRTNRLVRFGYIQIEGMADGVYLDKGERLKGHEFHYWDSDHNGEDCMARKPGRDTAWNCMHMRGNIFAGFPHIYYYSNVRFARRFVGKMRKYHSLVQKGIGSSADF